MTDIVWRDCPRCKEPCKLIPITPTFDPTGQRYGFQFFCSCGWYDPNRFYSYDEVKELIDKQKEQVTDNESK